jgi:hypothetical protein
MILVSEIELIDISPLSSYEYATIHNCEKWMSRESVGATDVEQSGNTKNAQKRNQPTNRMIANVCQCHLIVSDQWMLKLFRHWRADRSRLHIKRTIANETKSNNKKTVSNKKQKSRSMIDKHRQRGTYRSSIGIGGFGFFSLNRCHAKNVDDNSIGGE